MSIDKTRKKLDRIFEEVQPRLSEEVGGLMGATFTLSNISTRLISKEDFFDEPSGKVIFAKIDVTGEIDGKGGLLISVKDAIRLGGTLIMLPENELDQIIATEDYNEELADSYGEIANIIAGAYTKTFEEMHPKDFRFIRKELEIITSVKVDIESEEPLPDQNYYQVSSDMSLNDQGMGQLTLLIPAAPFGVDEETTVPVQDAAEQTAPQVEDEHVDGSSDSAENAEPDIEPVTSKPVGMSADKAKKKLDKVMEEVHSRLGDEVGGLMGVTLAFNDLSMGLISKEDFFDEPSGKLICAEVDVAGELEGKGCLLVSIKDAIRLGGTLLMIPDGELDENVAAEEYSEEHADSYGEIANIVAGVYTKTFEEMYPKTCRLIRKELEVLVPAKVDVESDSPVPDQNYYQVSTSMVLNEKVLGEMTMLLPAPCFGVDEVKVIPDDAPGAEEKTETVAATGSSEAEGNLEQGSESAVPSQAVDTIPVDPSFDAAKHKRRFDACLEASRKRMSDEVGTLLGSDVVLTESENRVVGKEDYFFDEASGKQILAHMDVVGEIEGKSYLYIGLKDAIHIGGTLVMLPPAELEKIVTEEDFSEDVEDAYGEIANIISGAYTAVFEEQYPQQVRFVKTDLEKVIPLKVDTDSAEPMPDQLYYMASSKLTIGTREMGKIQMLFPAALFQLESGSTASEAAAAEQGAPASTAEGTTPPGKTSQPLSSADGTSVRQGKGGSEQPELLIVSNDEQECKKITAVFDKRGHTYRVLNTKDNINDYLPGNVKAIFLLMVDVNEKGLGAAIKISSASSLPLVAAGPAWTKTKVIKAVRYGVDDILLTPASPDDIAEKIDSITVKLAA